MLTPKLEKEIRKWAKHDCGSAHPVTTLLDEIDELRDKLVVAEEALKSILEYGQSIYSHSFNLGLSAGTAKKALEIIQRREWTS